MSWREFDCLPFPKILEFLAENVLNFHFSDVSKEEFKVSSVVIILSADPTFESVNRG